MPLAGLVCMSQVYLKFGTFIISIKIWNCLYDRFLFNFFIFHHILVGHTNISLCEQLQFNIFMCTFVYFIIVVMTWYDFQSYSIVLPMYIFDQLFHTLSINFRGIIYFTT